MTWTRFVWGKWSIGYFKLKTENVLPHTSHAIMLDHDDVSLNCTPNVIANKTFQDILCFEFHVSYFKDCSLS